MGLLETQLSTKISAISQLLVKISAHFSAIRKFVDLSKKTRHF